MSKTPIRKWYFCLNATARKHYFEEATVAVNSCIRHTNLVPHCIYAGQPDSFSKWLEKNGVNVTFHTVPYLDEIRKVKKEEAF